VNVEVEGSAVANIEEAGLVVTFERVRGIARQADVSGAVSVDPLAGTGDIGESPLSQTYSSSLVWL
jgi:hypothetical protein